MKNGPTRKANTGRGRRKALEAVDLRDMRRPRPAPPSPRPDPHHQGDPLRMSVTTTIPIGPIRRPLLGLTTYLIVLTNTGSAPVLISSAPGDPVDGLTIPAGETRQFELQGRTLWLTSEEPTTLDVVKWTLDDLRADAAEEFNIPVEMLAGERSMAEIADFVLRFTARERGDQ